MVGNEYLTNKELLKWIILIHYSLHFNLYVGEFGANKRLVWPEQLPFGDRIKDQILYIPKGYKYENSPIKTILIYTGLGDVWEIPKLDQQEFFGCVVSQCSLTVNRSLAPEVDAVLFRHVYFRPSYKRPASQVNILLKINYGNLFGNTFQKLV